MVRASSFCCCVSLSFLSPSLLAGVSAALPGPGIDVAFDANGDGISSYGDRYVFNYWLALGGNLAEAMASAQIGRNGTIDVSEFLHSSDALLAPASTVESSSAGGGGALCGTQADLVSPFGDGTSPPESIFSSCQADLHHPGGAALDNRQGLWCTQHDPAAETADILYGDNGTARIDLSAVPPLGFDGRDGLGSSLITTSRGFGAFDIVVRETPTIQACPNGGDASIIHAQSTWTDQVGAQQHNLICPTYTNTDYDLCGTCRVLDSPDPFAIDAVRTGMPSQFGAAEDLIVSGKTMSGLVKITRIFTPQIPHTTPPASPVGCYPLESDPQPVSTDLFTFGSGVSKVWGLALGDFNGATTFGAYMVSQVTSTWRRVQRMVWDSSTLSMKVENFATLTGILQANYARTAAFDPISGDLFVSEDHASELTGTKARIWRVSSSGVVRLFGTKFNKPNGIVFLDSGAMLVVEEATQDATKGNVLSVTGWRNLFKRGDANGSGVVDISDSVTIANWLNQPSTAEPACLDGADADDNGQITTADTNRILGWLFNGGPAPPYPGPTTAGRDPTTDLMDCITSNCTGCPIN